MSSWDHAGHTQGTKDTAGGLKWTEQWREAGAKVREDAGGGGSCKGLDLDLERGGVESHRRV